MKRLFIIDDDKRFCESLQIDFEEKGIETHLFHDANIFSALEKEPTHLLIDLKLGQENGLTLIKKARDCFPQSKIIMLTGFGSISTAVRAIKEGANDYLTKPCPFEIIFEKLFGNDTNSEPPSQQPLSLAQNEREYIEHILNECGGNISECAKRLGIHRQSLQRKLKKYSPIK